MEATSSSETSVDFQRTTRRYIPEDRTLHPSSVCSDNSTNPTTDSEENGKLFNTTADGTQNIFPTVLWNAKHLNNTGWRVDY
jgi:hypothetical protein